MTKWFKISVGMITIGLVLIFLWNDTYWDSLFGGALLMIGTIINIILWATGWKGE